MLEYFFANYRMLIDEKITEDTFMQYLKEFERPMPYTDTFTIRMGDPAQLEEKIDVALKYPGIEISDRISVHDTEENWSIVGDPENPDERKIVCCKRDYSEITLYMQGEARYYEEYQIWLDPCIPFSGMIRIACEAGMALRGGLSLHASLVEKDGFGIVFLGHSGMGKSTQAKLWKEYLGADIIIGDRPGFHRIDGVWVGYGMPWDGKDGIKRQKSVPIKAFVSLEQAKTNQIRSLNSKEAMQVLLRQTMMPMWDAAAMDDLLRLISLLPQEIPFYHLQNLADGECVRMTCNTVFP